MLDQLEKRAAAMVQGDYKKVKQVLADMAGIRENNFEEIVRPLRAWVTFKYQSSAKKAIAFEADTKHN